MFHVIEADGHNFDSTHRFRTELEAATYAARGSDLTPEQVIAVWAEDGSWEDDNFVTWTPVDGPPEVMDHTS